MVTTILARSSYGDVGNQVVWVLVSSRENKDPFSCLGHEGPGTTGQVRKQEGTSKFERTEASANLNISEDLCTGYVPLFAL